MNNWFLGLCILAAAIIMLYAKMEVNPTVIEDNTHTYIVEKMDLFQDPQGRIIIRAEKVEPTKHIWEK